MGQAGGESGEGEEGWSVGSKRALPRSRHERRSLGMNTSGNSGTACATSAAKQNDDSTATCGLWRHVERHNTCIRKATHIPKVTRPGRPENKPMLKQRHAKRT